MEATKIISLPVKPEEDESDPVLWGKLFKEIGVGFSHVGYDTRKDDYHWFTVTCGRTRKELAALMTKVSKQLADCEDCMGGATVML